MTEAKNKETTYKYKGKGSFEPAIKIEEYLYNIIEKKGPITRPELTDLTGIPRTTIYDSIVRLILRQLIKTYRVLIRTRGRPRICYKVIAPYEGE